jgi:hypothetical protein
MSLQIPRKAKHHLETQTSRTHQTPALFFQSLLNIVLPWKWSRFVLTREVMSLLMFIKVPPAVSKLFLAVTPSAAIEIKDLSEFTYSYSLVLYATFDSDFIKSQTQIYRLEDVSTRLLILLVHYIYYAKVDTSIERHRHEGIEDVWVKNRQTVQGLIYL